jgi:hypothetical protein
MSKRTLIISFVFHLLEILFSSVAKLVCLSIQPLNIFVHTLCLIITQFEFQKTFPYR